ncbi:NADH:ubiquinone reductase (Na(+)-transporting) subunit F [Sunxiuqinia indica]|uniref:NADH:ubiquinone reductase (Na(+)-transporting) subunit F n=1 Tax=Sunxiuqinia indica TaxID=2692584 RepID=UPI00135A7BE4|nr:NADH:ubiquinone reductase (Na(+)-transporting) subunit F [Sunxiuqinia indica]
MSSNSDTDRDYSLIGAESKGAVEKGLADAQWYTSPVPKDKMRELLVRKDGPAIRDTLLWFGLIFGSGYLVYLWWGAWYVAFPYIVYSVLYASTSDSRWHESSHGTAFKTDWMNNVLYEISSFMVLRQSTVWRYSHARHHSDTIIRGRDPEIAVPRPPDIKQIILTFFGVASAVPEFKKMITHASGRIDPQVATYVPEREWRKVIFKARIYVSIFLFVIFLSVFYGTILPLMFIGLPTLFGTWLMPVYGFTQHAGLQENVLDHRLNCRTVYMNRVHRFLYWNMNYHVEHHMFPLVPYHNLPQLHELVKDDCPKPYNGIIETFKEIIPAILKQVKDPYYYVERKLPERSGQHDEQPDIIVGNKAHWYNGKIEICKASELAEGEIVRFDFEQRTYAVYHANGAYYATDGMCTHGNTHLSDGIILGDVIECPKHNGRFKLADGSPARTPVCVGLNTYQIEEEQGRLYLYVDLPDDQGKNALLDEGVAYRVVSNKNVATYIKELVLEKTDDGVIDYLPGQYAQFIIPPYEAGFKTIDVQTPFAERWEENDLFGLHASNSIYVKRNYSFATNPAVDTTIKFNVRLSLPPAGTDVSPGIGSSYLFNLKPGDQVKLTAPHGDFLIKPGEREMVYIGGGAGMAPLRAHLSYLLETKKTKRKLSFWYGARALDDLFYNEYFEEMEQTNENFSFHVALSSPRENDQWNGDLGFIHDVVSRRYLQSHTNPGNIEYYLCGPPALIKATLAMLSQLKVPAELISYDEFS